MNDDKAIMLIANRKYQTYLDFMAYQLRNCSIDTYVIASDDVAVPDGFRRIDPAGFMTEIGLTSEYGPNPAMTDTFLKLYIPFAKEFARYETVLYMDLDVELRPSWETVFDRKGGKFITACADTGINMYSGLNVFRYYPKNRRFSYANTGVMLFDVRSVPVHFASRDVISTWVKIATDGEFVYPDQDVLNLMNVIDCGLPPGFNCFRKNSNRIPDAKIIHYTSEVNAKAKFDEMIAASGWKGETK